MLKRNILDDFPTEVIYHVFDYLSVADCYKSFYDYDNRFRLITKKRTNFSRKDLSKDIERFSTLHSWYKHLSFNNGGTLFFLVPRKGQQARYSFDTRITDNNGLHWWFISDQYAQSITNEQIREIITRYPIKLNPFFYHNECKSNNQSSTEQSRYFFTGEIILSRYNISEWLKINYPDHVKMIEDSCPDSYRNSQYNLVPIFDGEWLKATTAIHHAAVQIWNQLKEVIDINPFQNEFIN